MDKVFKITDNEVELSDNMHVYKMHASDSDAIDVEKINWKNKPCDSAFFIDEDDDPYNGEMIFF